MLACTAFFNASSPTSDQIASFVDVKIKKAMGTFTKDIVDDVTKDLTDGVTYCVNATTTDNIWDYLSQKPTYLKTTKNKTTETVETNAVFVFVNGTKNEESQNDTTVQMSFVFYMGVYYFCVDTDSDDDI